MLLFFTLISCARVIVFVLARLLRQWGSLDKPFVCQTDMAALLEEVALLCPGYGCNSPAVPSNTDSLCCTTYSSTQVPYYYFINSKVDQTSTLLLPNKTSINEKLFVHRSVEIISGVSIGCT